MRIIITCLTGAALTLATVVPAAADFKVQMPDAETGEFSVEPIGDIGQDPNPAHNGELSSVTEFEYGVNSFWRTELELEQDRARRPRPIDPLQSGHLGEHSGVHRTRRILGWTPGSSLNSAKRRWPIRPTR